MSDKNLIVLTYKEEKYFTAYKVKENEKNRLLIVVHFVSPMQYSELARNQRANDLARIIEKVEESCNREAKEAGERRYGMAVVGDFNLHPFSAGIIGMHGFNAIMDWERALENNRIFCENKIKFYYNPMWNLMGKKGYALGTYYNNSDQDDNSFYWYTFDQILLRTELMEDFIWDEFEILDHIGNNSLIKNHKIYDRRYSDHLPVKFAFC